MDAGKPRLATVLAMLNGELEISHDMLDSHDHGQATGYLRAALVAADALDARDETLARFARWADAQVDELPEHPDRVHLAAYARWALYGDLARRTNIGAAKRNTHRNARRKLRVAIMLTRWLHDQGRILADVRQDLVEDWLTDAPSRSLPLRDFLKWAHRTGITPPIEIRRPAPRASIEPIDHQASLIRIRALLDDDDVELPARVAGILVLLLGQPVTRLVALKHSDVTHDDDRVLLALGREPVQLPPPLATLVLRLAEQATGTPWLFPGAKPGAPISCNDAYSNSASPLATAEAARSCRSPARCRRRSSPTSWATATTPPTPGDKQPAATGPATRRVRPGTSRHTGRDLKRLRVGTATVHSATVAPEMRCASDVTRLGGCGWNRFGWMRAIRVAGRS
jgi:hypothetical protein